MSNQDREPIHHNDSETVSDITAWARDHLLLPDTRGELVYLKQWRDLGSNAIGWLARWGDPNLNVSGGGIRMKPGGKPEEAIFLASTMYEKFGIAGPEINGSKFVIDFDPSSQDKSQVLGRFLGTFLLDLDNIGTAGDMGVSEEEVASILSKLNIQNPQFGILNGLGLVDKVGRLDDVMHLPLQEGFSRMHQYLVDVTAGWSTFSAINTYFRLKGDSLAGKTVAIHGIGAVGGSVGYYLEREGAVIVEIADRLGSMSLKTESFKEIIADIDPSSGCIPRSDKVVPHGDNMEVLFSPADVIVVAAGSDVISIENATKIRSSVIVEGANHPIIPEADRYLNKVGVEILPDFVVNAGTAELFTIGMLGRCDVTEEAILSIIAQITNNAMEHLMVQATQENITYREAARAVSTQKLWKEIV